MYNWMFASTGGRKKMRMEVEVRSLLRLRLMFRVSEDGTVRCI